LKIEYKTSKKTATLVLVISIFAVAGILTTTYAGKPAKIDIVGAAEIELSSTGGVISVGYNI
jgi:hypothetical protein